MNARDRLIVALDVTGRGAAEDLVQGMGESVSFYKIGYQLALSGGLDLARDLALSGKRVFLDLKLHDIGNTVREGTEAAAELGATFLTVHAYPQTLAAAVEGARGFDLKILGVSVLTSYDDADVAAAGYGLGLADLVRHRAAQVVEAGAHGLVCSPHEAAGLRQLMVGRVLVTPGVRPAGAAQGDQKRVMTPAQAIGARSDYLVVGRPITGAADPRAAVEAIVAEIEEAAS